jgi:hypothetical protein
MSRALRTRAELIQLFMAEIDKYAECRDMGLPTVSWSQQRLYGSNWEIVLAGGGSLFSSGRVGNAKKIVDAIVRKLQEQFDCSDC